MRRPKLDELKIFRIRVDIDHAEPPIWRSLYLRSDLTLNVVHRALQVAFGWTDSHLHPFSLGGRQLNLGQLPEEDHVVLGDPDGNEFSLTPA
ncbi:MAG: hypothetical protein WKF73_22180 [Nocardioidaceae bacterium]